ncbi:hypothetical protein RSSM_03008 [Rhodopirellula sallentina SM41]|uniref:Uncharacterized protein n=1 Tax=Rhodopirellula sallentina SM41 TaxID=1263870 RepID=M5UHP1_9BACT|nr:hypothetical protein RSSM_03008 [Rhodopirellula sallentina SM41]
MTIETDLRAPGVSQVFDKTMAIRERLPQTISVGSRPTDVFAMTGVARRYR